MVVAAEKWEDITRAPHEMAMDVTSEVHHFLARWEQDNTQHTHTPLLRQMLPLLVLVPLIPLEITKPRHNHEPRSWSLSLPNEVVANEVISAKTIYIQMKLSGSTPALVRRINVSACAKRNCIQSSPLVTWVPETNRRTNYGKPRMNIVLYLPLLWLHVSYIQEYLKEVVC